MTIAAPAKTSVLAKLTASVMEEKRTAARTLTPVPGEEKPAPTFPSDLPGAFMSHEGMFQSAKDLRRHADTLVQIANALDEMSGFDSLDGRTRTVKPSDIQREKEREADERVKAKEIANDPPEAVQTTPREAVQTTPRDESFADRQTRLAEEAQAAAFTPTGWTCPTHGKAVPKTSSKGREYNGCPDCSQFER
jgi:hypothetical protein